MKPNKSRLVLAFLMLCLTFTASAEIYKWTDANGKTHYSQTPPEDTSTKAKDIGDEIDMAAGTASQGNTGSAEKNTDETGNELDKSREKGKENSVTHQSYCDQQQAALKKLLENPVIRWKSKESEKILSFKERQNKISEFEKSIKEMCNSDVLPKQEKANNM